MVGSVQVQGNVVTVYTFVSENTAIVARDWVQSDAREKFGGGRGRTSDERAIELA
jgi:hypothetical protein